MLLQCFLCQRRSRWHCWTRWSARMRTIGTRTKTTATLDGLRNGSRVKDTNYHTWFPTCRIIPVCRWLITMVIHGDRKSPSWCCSPPKWPFHGLSNWWFFRIWAVTKATKAPWLFAARWKPNMEVWKMSFLFKEIILMLHLSFQRCSNLTTGCVMNIPFWGGLLYIILKKA